MDVWQMEAQAERDAKADVRPTEAGTDRVASALERIADALEQMAEQRRMFTADERAAEVAEKIGPVLTHLARHTREVDRG